MDWLLKKTQSHYITIHVYTWVNPPTPERGFFISKYFCYIISMNYSKIFLGILFGILGQIGTFMQLQVSYKFGWYRDYPWVVILASVPLGWLYIQSVNSFIEGFGGQIWPSRLVGFSIGIIVFTLMSHFLFKEHLSIKNAICLLLGFCILAIQLFVKN